MNRIGVHCTSYKSGCYKFTRTFGYAVETTTSTGNWNLSYPEGIVFSMLWFVPPNHSYINASKNCNAINAQFITDSILTNEDHYNYRTITKHNIYVFQMN